MKNFHPTLNETHVAPLKQNIFDFICLRKPKSVGCSLYVFFLLRTVDTEVSEPTLPSSIEMSDIQFSMLKCNFTARPKANISWVYANQIEAITTSAHGENSGLYWTAGSFSITSVPKVCANYIVTCVGENQFGGKQQSVTLNITSK